MRKLFIALFMLVTILTTSGHAADVWQFRVDEVTTPSLKSIDVRYTIVLNGADYITEYIVVRRKDLQGKNLAQRKVFIGNQIKALIGEYKGVYDSAINLSELNGQVFNYP